ncbi:putative D-aminoacyl-tRNA deacylase-like protein [Paenibacillus sp. J53TS2]|uniref:D-aminoacyl-tRNA deacylase n=1 Tax=Paenibacillus sp. J53TS2 TaxID=2807197 RepID=UPI001B22C497|nr:D-aminoacyl-tRNA deacylase [Paenibacillus sp. J53TS2]GIP50469.1 putative D-aminoacyl-tRNA deacylase-like protein [Paenibacillus sp. J53TS2]
MRVVVQRCREARVNVGGETVGAIGPGLMLLVGVTHEDTEQDAAYLAEKIAGLRIFEDKAGKMNLAVTEIGGAILSVSQFTLYGDSRKGRRPNFMAAARPEMAEPLYERFNELLRAKGLTVETGVFGAEMDVGLTNWGPVTLIVDSPGGEI